MTERTLAIIKPDAVERQLGHDEKNKVRGAYNSAQYMPERKRLLQEWADWLDQAEREARKEGTSTSAYRSVEKSRTPKATKPKQ